MSSRILDYSKWKQIHESKQMNEGLFWDVTETEPIGGTNHKVKVKYIDANSIKVKAVNDRDLVGEGGTVDQNLMDNVVIFLNGHDKTNFSREYPALQNMATFYKDNFFTYNVKKENDRRQVVVFSIQQRANFKGVTPETKLISDDAAAKLAQAPEAKAVLANSDKSLLQNTATTDNKPAVSAIKIEKPIAFSDLKGDAGKSGAPIFNAMDSTYAALKGVKEISSLPFFAKLKTELKAGQLGDTAISFAKGIVAGFGLKDKYDDPLEVIDQSVADKLAMFAPKTTTQNSSRKYYLGLNGKMLVEQAAPAATNTAPVSAIPAGFDLKAFTDAVGGAAPTTGDIKLPEGGIKKAAAAKGDTELKKVQQLIIDKLGVVLAKDPTFIKFKGYGADGNYGPTTEKVVAMAKAGFELNDTDGSTVTADLINKLLTDKITESYLDLNGNLFEKFNVEAATKTSSTYAPNTAVKPAVKKEDAAKPDEAKTPTDSKPAADEVIKMLRDASQVMSDYYKNEGNFTEYKSGWGDDEAKASSEIFGTGMSDTSSWWYRNIWNKYVIPAKSKIGTIKDAVISAALTKEYQKMISLYTNLKAKTAGGTEDDEYTWSIADLDGNKVTYTVDTDF